MESLAEGESVGSSDLLLISVDASEQIGLGHLMRCLSIADAARDRGCKVIFVVSNEYASAIVAGRAHRALVVERDEIDYSMKDAEVLAEIASEGEADRILVDSYGVSDSFFRGLKSRGRAHRVFYIDDGFSFSCGHREEPYRWDIEGIIDYSFGSSYKKYERTYSAKETKLMIGPRFAPIRSEFRDSSYTVRGDVEEVLITSGSTNPNHVLERMCAAAAIALPDSRFNVVVGPKSRFEPSGDPSRYDLHIGVDDLSHLMIACDLAISACGTTLYELCAIGVPTVAIPIVENQRANAQGFASLHLGKVVPDGDTPVQDIANAVVELASHRTHRQAYSKSMRALVKGDGAQAIVDGLYDTADIQ